MNDFLSRLKRIPAPGYIPDAACVARADAYVRHELDILGSGTTEMRYGVVPKGFEGYLYPNPDDTYEALRLEADAKAPGYVDVMHRAEALSRSLVPGYRPIPWHTDIRNGYVYALDWHERVPVNKIPGVDAKTASDMSRAHHWLTLAKAWRVTGNPVYRNEVMAQICDWIASNPPYYGPGWRNGMNVSVRAANIIAASSLLNLDEIKDAEFIELLYETLCVHRRHIALSAEIYRPHNHVMAEITGLVIITSLLASQESADMEKLENRAWERIAWRDLNIEINRQINPDGFDFENSVSYHAYVLEMMLYPALCAARAKGCRTASEVREFLVNKERLNKKALSNIRNAARVLCLLTQPDGTIPYIGDNDSGRYIPWESEALSGSDMRPLSCVAACLFNDPSLLPACVRDEDFSAARAFFDDAEPFASTHLPESVALAQCGYAILTGDSYHCVFKCGGETSDKGHINNDQLAITLCADGESIVVDPGTYSYTGHIGWRKKLRSLTKHSTVFVDNEETDRLVCLQPFGGSGSDTNTECLRFENTRDGVICTGAHNAWFRLPEMLTVERTLNCKEGCIKVCDRFTRLNEAPREGQTVERFLLHPDCEVTLSGERSAIVRKNGVTIQFVTENGKFTVEEADFSPTYGVRVATNALSAILPRNAEENLVTISWR